MISWLFTPQQLERFGKSLELELYNYSERFRKFDFLHFSDFNSFFNWRCSCWPFGILYRSLIRESLCLVAGALSGLRSIIETIKILGSRLLALPGQASRAAGPPKCPSGHPPLMRPPAMCVLSRILPFCTILLSP